MPMIDFCQPNIVRALQKDGWHVDDTPFLIPLPARRSRLLADIKANRKEEEIIVAEVKCFERNTPDELYTAIGQYLIYRNLISKMEHPRPLYLAIPTDAYYGIVSDIGMDVITENRIKIVVVNLQTEVIEKWIE